MGWGGVECGNPFFPVKLLWYASGHVFLRLGSYYFLKHYVGKHMGGSMQMETYIASRLMRIHIGTHKNHKFSILDI